MESLFDISGPSLGVTSDGLQIISPKVAESLGKKNLSASLITGIEKCPASWLADTFVIRDLIPENPDNAARRGSLFHKVLEDFFTLEPDNRTKEKMLEVVDNVLKSPEFADMYYNKDAVQWLRDAVNGYYNMGAKPEKIKIATITTDKGKTLPGLEVFVKGHIGNCSRDILGFIDRLSYDPKLNDGSVIIEDYKSGGKVHKWNPNTKSTEGLGEARQQMIYAELLRNEYGMKVSSARLIFPVAEEIVKIDVNNESFRKRVIEDVEKTDALLNDMIEDNEFPYKPSVLCAWCPMQRLCPAKKILKHDKMQRAAEASPTIEQLAPGFEVI